MLKSASALGESFSSRHVRELPTLLACNRMFLEPATVCNGGCDRVQVRELHAVLALQPASSKVDANLGKLRELQQLEFHSEQLSRPTE